MLNFKENKLIIFIVHFKDYHILISKHVSQNIYQDFVSQINMSMSYSEKIRIIILVIS